MPVSNAYAVLCVRDLTAAVAWYARLVGRDADDRPMPGVADWYLGSAGLSLVEDRERAGRGLATLAVDGLDGELDALAHRGVERGQRVGGGVQIVDPDGNLLTLVERRRHSS